MQRPKLFRLVRDLSYPYLATLDRSNGHYRSKFHTQPGAFAVVWPNGVPCYEAELYLLDVASRYTVRKTDGGSLKGLAGDISHLLRFVYAQNMRLWEMTDADMKDAIAGLQEERNPIRPYLPRRNGDTIDRIVDRWIRFFTWLQESWIPERVIVGTADSNPQIPLHARPYTDHRGLRRVVFKYRYIPIHATPEKKGPIPRDLKIRLWGAVARLSNPESASISYRQRFKSEADFHFLREYVRRRRELLLQLLEATGARPGELARIKVSLNEDCSATTRITLDTLKRRTTAQRSIPIEHGVAIQIELFIVKYRARLLEMLRDTGVVPNPEDRLLLSTRGAPISEISLDKEFRRIVYAAEAAEEQACMSMFRHRFITNMVKLHLIGFMTDNPGRGRHSMTESDYRTILKRVATFTGHGSEESLFDYIDLAWNEMGIFDYVEPAAKLVNCVERGITTLTSIVGDLRTRRHLSAEQLLDDAVVRLEGIRNEVTAALQVNARKVAV